MAATIPRLNVTEGRDPDYRAYYTPKAREIVETYVTDANGAHYVLRRPPLGHVLREQRARRVAVVAEALLEHHAFQVTEVKNGTVVYALGQSIIVENRAGASFWEHNGWLARTDLRVMQKPIGSGAPVRRTTSHSLPSTSRSVIHRSAPSSSSVRTARGASGGSGGRPSRSGAPTRLSGRMRSK